MARAQDPAVSTIKAGLKQAWQDLRKAHPAERVYAFGVYTAPAAEFLMPFACGEQGLARVAERYVKDGVIYKTLAQAAAGLRWSVPDSPYEKFFSKSKYELDEPFDENPLVLEPESKMLREVHRRLTAAANALKALDAEGLFGRGKAREQVVLLIEAGDRPDEWAHKWAKKLNPAKVFEAYRKAGGEPDEIGTFTEFGTKKVYRTSRLSATADRSLIAAASEYHYFMFRTSPLKQLAVQKVGDSVIPDVALSADGTVLAAHVDAGHSTPGHLVWAGPPDWKERERVRLPVRGMSLVIDPAGRWAAVGDEKGQVQVHARAGGKPTLLKGHKDWVRGLAVSADGKTLAALGGGTLVAWDTATWKPRAKFKDQGDVIDVDRRGARAVCAVAFGALDKPKQGDRATIARVYDLASGKVVKDVEVPGFSISRAVFSPNGRQLALAVKPFASEGDDYPDDEAALVDLASGGVLARLKAGFESVDDFAFLPERNEIAVAVHAHTRRPLVLWKMPEGVRID